MAQHATSRTIDVVTSIWQQVLHRPSVGARENFFEIGGDPKAAAELFCEIERRLGRHVPPMMIFHTPTIASLTDALEDSTFPNVPPLTQIRPGDRRRPLFIAHGVGGSVLEFHELVKHIDYGHAIYGMQAKGSDGKSGPLDRIEEMAQFHLDAIRQLQPHGPYFLAGHSLGGLVVLEIARQVLESGDDPGLVVMIDSYPHLKHLPPSQQARLIARLAARRFFRAKEPSASARATEASKPAQGLEQPAAIKEATRRVRESGYVALENYRPRFYDGKIHFIRAKTASVFPDNPAAIWAQFARSFELETVSGDHFGILARQAGALAAVLSRYAREPDGRMS